MLSHSFSLLALWHGKVETNVLKYGTRNDEISHLVAMYTQYFLSQIRIYSSATFSIIFNSDYMWTVRTDDARSWY